MALDSNVMSGKNGQPLKHFTPYHMPFSKGINMFSQIVGIDENCYVFPPYNLALPVIKFIIQNGLKASIVLTLGCITPYWLPEISPFISDAFILGQKGETDVIEIPSKKGFISDEIGLVDNFWVVRILQQKQTKGGG